MKAASLYVCLTAVYAVLDHILLATRLADPVKRRRG